MHRLINSALFLLITSFQSVTAYGDIINFEGGGYVDRDVIVNEGSGPNLNVSYRQVNSFGAGAYVNNLQFWDTDYGSLENVVWGPGDTKSNVGEIKFEALNGNVVTLSSLDTALYQTNNSANYGFRVYNADYTELLYDSGVITLAQFTGGTYVDDQKRTISLNNVTGETLILQWQYPWNAAVDNINFTVSSQAVPEPCSMALVSIGAGTMLYFKRRKKHTERENAVS